MSRQPENLLQSRNVTVADFGGPDQWQEHQFVHPMRGEVKGKVFLAKTLNLTGMEVSLGSLPPGAAMPFLHAHHQNEELYLVLSGRGEFQVDGEVFPLVAGSAVRVAPDGMRCWRALGSEPLVYLVVQAQAGSLHQATLADGYLGEQAPVW